MATKKAAKKPKKKPPAKKLTVLKAAADGSRTLTFIGTVTSESADIVHLLLNGSEISLKQDGSTFSGKKKISVDDTVTVKFTVGGFNGTDWSMQVDIDCPDGPVKVLSKKGTVGETGGLGFEKDAKVPASPCG